MIGPRICRSSYCNLLLGGENELAGGPPGASTKGSNTLTPSPSVFPAQTPADAPAPTPAPPRGTYTDVDLQKATKLALESFFQGQAHVQGSKPKEKPLKARFPNLYWGNSHQDCYRFCQQCEDHFETAGAKGSNRILFATFFSNDRWCNNSYNIRGDTMGLYQWHEPNSRPFFGRISETFEHLLMTSGVN